jgi:hypothetical protein
MKTLLLSLVAVALFAGCACEKCEMKKDAAPMKHSHGSGKDVKNY